MAVTITAYELAKALGLDLEDVAPSLRERSEADASPGFPARRADLGVEENRASKLRDVAADAVMLFAPDAPEETANEAVIRMAGWLWERRSGLGAVSSAEGVTILPLPGAPSALRASGAAAILAPHRSHRAGICEAEDA